MRNSYDCIRNSYDCYLSEIENCILQQIIINLYAEGGALGAKLAGVGGTIIALTLGEEKSGKALLEAGAEKIIKLDSFTSGIEIFSTDNASDEVAASS